MTITKYIKPCKIEKGDTIGMLSTARAVESEEIEYAKSLIQNQGFNVICGATIGARENQFAGNDELRLNDLQTMLDNPNIDAIICVRGGYGTSRLLDKINWNTFREKPKWIMGYSDITALHNTLSRLGFMSIHGIMPINIKDEDSELALNHALEIMQGKDYYAIDLPKHSQNRVGNAVGILTGGNLSILYSMRSTPFDIIFENRILFFEDLDEYLYHIDRMMVNLELSGALRAVSAVVVGGLTEMNDNIIPYGKKAEEIVVEHIPDDIPLFFGASFGHIQKNLPIVCGAKGTIEQENSLWRLKYEL